MRTIKFRAWDKGTKRMFSFPLTSLYEAQQYPEKIEIMQFTGLLDRNGKEIYEGDVITYLDVDGRRLKSVVVKWIEEDARFSFGTPYAKPLLKAIEVLGNIYENPSLINP